MCPPMIIFRLFFDVDVLVVAAVWRRGKLCETEKSSTNPIEPLNKLFSMLFCVLGYGFFGEIELHFSLSLHQAIIFQFPTMLASLEMHVE